MTPTTVPARRLIAAGALLCAIAVGAGAFGAHALRDQLEPRALEQWTTAARYLIYAGFGTVICGLIDGRGRSLGGFLLIAGGCIFALAVGGLALGGPRYFGAIAPLGGLGMILGFVTLAVAALRPSP